MYNRADIKAARNAILLRAGAPHSSPVLSCKGPVTEVRRGAGHHLAPAGTQTGRMSPPAGWAPGPHQGGYTLRQLHLYKQYQACGGQDSIQAFVEAHTEKTATMSMREWEQRYTAQVRQRVDQQMAMKADDLYRNQF